MQQPAESRVVVERVLRDVLSSANPAPTLLEVSCPSCVADAGHVCMLGERTRAESPHASRVKLWRVRRWQLENDLTLLANSDTALRVIQGRLSLSTSRRLGVLLRNAGIVDAQTLESIRDVGTLD